MNWRIFSIGFTFVLTLTTSPLLLANGDETGIAHRVATLEQQMTTLLAEQERVSPDADLTGKTYCMFGQGTWLNAGNGAAEIYSNPFSYRLDFTSATEFTVTGIYDPYVWIALPDYTMGDGDDTGAGTGQGTYTIVGNRLTVGIGGEGGNFYMTPDARVFVRGFFERTAGGGVDWWETGIVIGVQADSCD
jgi:hypothetical protein